MLHQPAVVPARRGGEEVALVRAGAVARLEEGLGPLCQGGQEGKAHTVPKWNADESDILSR